MGQDTYLTRLHSLAKLFYILVAITVPLVTGKVWVPVLFIIISLCLLVNDRITARVFPLTAFSFTIIATMFLVHGLFNQASRSVLLVLGLFRFYREGLVHVARVGFSILNILLAFVAFVLSTKPSQLVNDLEQIGFSLRLGYVVSSVLQIIPQMMGIMSTIMDAQWSRGVETGGNLFMKTRVFIPFIAPVVSSSLINIREGAVALEVRGFDSGEKETFLTGGKMDGRDKALIPTMCLIIADSVIQRMTHIVD